MAAGGRSKQAEKDAKESLVVERDAETQGGARAAAAERAERRANAEARRAEETDDDGASNADAKMKQRLTRRRSKTLLERLGAFGAGEGPDRGGGVGGGGGGG